MNTKHSTSGNQEFRELMEAANWSAVETARVLEVSASSISAYLNNVQSPPPAKLKLLRHMVQKMMNKSSENEVSESSENELSATAGQVSPGGGVPKKNLRQIRLEALFHRVETLAACLRSLETTAEKVEGAEELAGLASELAKKLKASGI